MIQRMVIFPKKRGVVELDAQQTTKIWNIACLVFEIEMCIVSGAAQIYDLTTPPTEKVTVHLWGSTPKIPIITVVKVSSDLCSGVCANGGYIQIDANLWGGWRWFFLMKYYKLASSVGNKYDVHSWRITVITYPYFSSSKRGATYCFKQKPDILQMQTNGKWKVHVNTM